MSTTTARLACVTVASILFSTPLHAQSCKPEQSWKAEHSKVEADTIAHDIKGSRATRIEVCRAKDASGEALKVELLFEGGHDNRKLPQGECLDKFAKWAVIKSHGKQVSDGVPAIAHGSYKICRE